MDGRPLIANNFVFHSHTYRIRRFFPKQSLTPPLAQLFQFHNENISISRTDTVQEIISTTSLPGGYGGAWRRGQGKNCQPTPRKLPNQGGSGVGSVHQGGGGFRTNFPSQTLQHAVGVASLLAKGPLYIFYTGFLPSPTRSSPFTTPNTLLLKETFMYSFDAIKIKKGKYKSRNSKFTSYTV